MGYEVHITRKRFWSDKAGLTIGGREWHDLVAHDPSMRPMKNGDVTWVRYSKHAPGRREAKFRLGTCGDVSASFPDTEMRARMHRIALTFNARVQGDCGELYDDKGEVVMSSLLRLRGGPLLVVLSVLGIAVGAGLYYYMELKPGLHVLVLSGCVLLVEFSRRVLFKKRA